MEQVSKTEENYKKIVDENKTLRSELRQIHDRGFVEKFDRLQDHYRQNTALLRQCSTRWRS